MPTNRRRVGRAGGSVVTDAAVRLYREGIAIEPGNYHDRHVVSRVLAAELRAETLLPCLLDDAPCFLLAVADEEPYRATWAELKAELQEAAA